MLEAVQLDTSGLICPEPIMLLHKTIRKIASGQTIILTATDPATQRDIPQFCQHLGHVLLEVPTSTSPPYIFHIQKRIA